ncbi:FecCD family ABC transporter permease [Thermoproteus tenax]|uniref:ABC-type Fe3+-siderophore transport system, permease component n=1 Tax=Thermoproteus tenax (strain ATCC 35583 / DSM 2078 / JCM 9277 / NBRC 100435 / Kra 1) TaxID=768679 RepID=G4RMY8_THETK|nr:iron ABC transporter permease [Thermoproteus tenax]CCC80932.1 ABC-type Fe3+-siderophore transport system, permease component [Thermoproteus tenax Kra 1]
MRVLASYLLLVGVLVALFLSSLSVGAYNYSPLDVLKAALWGSGTEALVAKMRLARAVTAVAVGATLAVAGAALQAVLRNPLASPFTLGIPQAAALGVAVAVMVAGAGTVTRGLLDISNPYLVVGLAFLSALLNGLLVLFLASLTGFSVASVVLAMVVVSSVYQAALALLQYLYLNDIQTAAVVFWTFGDVGRPSYWESFMLLAVAAASALYFLANSAGYNLVAVGEEVAKTSGVDPARLRLTTLVAVTLAVAVLVSFTGVIGFVGLAAPHIARLLVGGSHTRLIPASAAAGAALVLGADIVGRVAKPPVIIPVGITLSFVGAAFILALLFRLRKYGEY